MPTKPGTYATFKTSQGTIVCELFEKDAPETVANFIGLAEGTKDWNSRSKKGAKLYDGTIFHRVIPDFMIQGGDPEGTGMGGPGYKFADETRGSKHGFQEKGKLAMANAGPNTNGSQFFITVPPPPGSPANTLSSAKSSKATTSSKKSRRSAKTAWTAPKPQSPSNPLRSSAFNRPRYPKESPNQANEGTPKPFLRSPDFVAAGSKFSACNIKSVRNRIIPPRVPGTSSAVKSHCPWGLECLLIRFCSTTIALNFSS